MRILFFVMCVYACRAHDFEYFERTLASKPDGYESVWSLDNIDCEIDAFAVTDSFLQSFLGINEQYPYVLLTLKDNATDFDTHVWEPSEWNMVTAKGSESSVAEQISTLRAIKDTLPPKIWKQPAGLHDLLHLEHAPETLNGTNISFTLYFANASNALGLADIMHVVGAKYPEVDMYCWDLMISDGPRPFKYLPTVAVRNEAVHGAELKELEQPFTQKQFDMFVDANLEMQDINAAYIRHIDLDAKSI